MVNALDPMYTVVDRIALMSLLLFATGVNAQVIPAERATDWSTAGFQLPIPEATLTLDITAFGGTGDGVTPNGGALTAAFAAAQGQMTVIQFPPGNFLFTSSIFLPDSVILRGATADSTTFTFTLSGAGYCISASGQEGVQQFPLSQGSVRGGTHLWTSSTAGIAPGDEIRLYRDDAALVVSAWALGTTGQIARVVSVDPDGVEIASPLRANYPLTAAPYFTKLQPLRYAGIECLRILRTDATPPDEWSNIFFGRASHCWVRGVESDHCNFAHIELFASTNCQVSGCYLHHAFAYGGSGQGYGVLAYYTAGENYVYDNIFEHLRHAMIVLAGANGNVFAYNRSVDPYWNEGIFPTNSAGEIVLHGDHPYLNLFESNIVQNIVIDDSHGKNGPFNTLFRNRATLWGLVMNNSPATDSVNFVGNEIIGSPGLYVISGNGHLEHGNNVNGTITPSGTGGLTDVSYYASMEPTFLQAIGGWPQVGPNSVSPGSIPAAERYASGNGFTVCQDPEISTGISSLMNVGGIRCHPVPFDDRLVIDGVGSGVAPFSVTITDALGSCTTGKALQSLGPLIEVNGLGDLPAGFYVVNVVDANGRSFSASVVKR